jgi:GT2 family glycosyltransferase/glycosyltransferase involved in cell wall biosynthesis
MTSKLAISDLPPAGSALAALADGREALAAGDRTTAIRHLDRALRLAPRDAAAAFLLASVLSTVDASRALAMLRSLTAAHKRFWAAKAALAALLSRAGDAQGAAALLDDMLRHAAPPDDATFRQLAATVARDAGLPGWIAIDSRGMARCHGFGTGARYALDGHPIWPRAKPDGTGRLRLPAGWETAGSLTATLRDRHFLGSPVILRAHVQAEGFVDLAANGDLTGWAWLPGDPDTPARLTVHAGAGTAALLTICADDAGFVPEDGDGVARPRGFRVPAAQRPSGDTLHVCGPDGTDLFGSPVRVGAAARNTPLKQQIPRRAAIDVIVPIYRGAADFRACLASLRRALPARTRVVVVDDASPDPDLCTAAAQAAAEGAILLRHPRNRGFPAAANTGLRHAAEAGRDAVLLNPDTLVPRDWLKHLAQAAYAAADIGTVTPMTNDGTIVSYPAMDQADPPPDQAGTDRQHARFRAANAGLLVDLPTAVGFCMYIRHNCLAETGLFREDMFAQGYGEENDFCLRASALGWRHVADTGCFVAHAGGRTFGGAKAALLARNMKVLNRLHPGYDAAIAAFLAADPLAPARRRIDAVRWEAGRCQAGAVILVSHNMGGGVERHVRERATLLRSQGLRPILLQPAGQENAPPLCTLSDGADDPFPNLHFDPAAALADLADFLRPDRPRWIELHHLVGHAPGITGLARALKIPFDIVVHDYAAICPRISLVAGARMYCGEPVDIADCEACVADNGSRLGERISVAALRARSAALANQARTMIVPTNDTANRLARYMRPRNTALLPWQNDAPGPTAPPPHPANHTLHVCIVGAIGEEKGFYVLLACARDAARRNLNLRFTVVGHTMDDTRLIDTGRVFITGAYEEHEAVELIHAQNADIGFLPSVWPETWCYALTALWQAALFPVAFDIGAQAERIKHAGAGKLLPLGFPPPRINDVMLQLLRGG